MESSDVFNQLGDLLVDVLRRVGRVSAKDAFRAACATKLLNKTLKEPSVMKALNLSDFVTDPTLMDQVPRFFDLALSSGNPHALYLQGMSTLLVAHDVDKAVPFFNKASKGGIDKATFMFAICAIAYGQYPRALELLDRVVGWRSRMHYMLGIAEEVANTIKGMQSDGGGLLPNVLGPAEYPKCNFKHRVIGCEECYLFVQYQLLKDEI